MRFLYTLALSLLTPILLIRSARKYSGEYWDVRQRLGFGCPALKRPVWLHAASVGEARAIAPLAQRLSAQYSVLITTTTPTGRDQVLALVPGATHAFLPYDLPWAMRAWIDQLNPRALILVETELWPNLIHQASRQGVPVVLANARMSQKSERGYARFSALTRPMLEQIQVLAQTESHRAAFQRLGASHVQVIGNLKYDLPTLDAARVQHAQAQLGAGIWWVAASTHAGEELACLQAFQQLAKDHPELRLLLVPRHPQRFDQVAALAQEFDAGAQRLSVTQQATSRVVVGDAMGQLHAWLTQAQLAFIGGTLIEHGGQSPIEAAAEGCVILAGPSRYNFPQVFEQLAQGALIDVTAERMDTDVAEALTQDGSINQRLIAQHRGATERTQAVIEALVIPK